MANRKRVMVDDLLEWQSSSDEEDETPEWREECNIRHELQRCNREMRAHQKAIDDLKKKTEELTKRLNELCPPYVPMSPSYSPTSPAYAPGGEEDG